MTAGKCAHKWRPPVGREIDAAEKGDGFVHGTLICEKCDYWWIQKPSWNPAAALDPAAPMTPAQHEAWHAAMAPDLSAMTMTDEEAAEFAERFAVAMAERKAHPLRVLHREPPLTPDQVRSLLRECVTVVKPGEVLVIRFASGAITSSQHREYIDAMEPYAGEMGIRAMVVVGDGLGVAEAAS